MAPPLIIQSPIRLSGLRLLGAWLHELIHDDCMSYCEWRQEGLLFRSRYEETLVPLKEVGAFWRLNSRPPIFEVQLKDTRAVQWRWVFVVASVHWGRSKALVKLRQAIREANPEASIEPPPQ
ncbi:MAG: hypothetical protein J0L84_03855 [Verrucomicrobia bacterium]|nr:hypothetical protein [Verrucomicrobiota bacterium]